MPTYEYVCTDCQSHWEEIQKISEDPIQICPKCGKSTAKRQISGGNFILKGGGWYADLYSSTPKKGSDTTSSSSNGSSSESKTPSTAPKADTAGSTSAGAASSGAGSSSTGASSK